MHRCDEMFRLKVKRPACEKTGLQVWLPVRSGSLRPANPTRLELRSQQALPMSPNPSQALLLWVLVSKHWDRQ